MLTFFRKHQRIFFLFITIVVIVTFAFFGTYNALGPSNTRDETAFEAVDGKAVSASYVDQMAYFLRSDAKEASLRSHMQRTQQGNFLNDGVVTKDFLQSGMAQVIFQHYFQELSSDIQARLDKEKYFSAYKHPYANFIAAENVWQSFAPELKSSYDVLKVSQDATQQEAFDARVTLYLLERNFPPAFLRQVLLYQEKQYEWLPADQNLMYENLSLFGYRDLNDWFGPKFTRLLSQVIINSAAIAKERGYKVSKEEAFANLLYHSEQAFQSIQDKTSLSAKNGYGYLQEYLRLTQIDEISLTRLWQDVLLFRRLFNDIGASVLVDALACKDFSQYAHQAAEIDLYTMPQEFQFNNLHDLQLFEVYLDAIAGQERDPLLLPQTLESLDNIEKKAPQLVEKRYWVELASINKKQLQSKVGIRETWEWQVQDGQWEILKTQFPQLALHPANDQDSRFQILESLDEKTRALVDQYTRLTIVDQHPEWIAEALEKASFHEEVLALSEQSSLAGISYPQTFALQLDAQNFEEFFDYTQDQTHFYRIRVKEKASSKNVLTFREALDKGHLEKMLKPILETDAQFGQSILKHIEEDCKSQEIIFNEEQNSELVRYRLFAHFRKAQENIVSDIAESDQWLAITPQEPPSLIKRPGLIEQWKIFKAKEIVSRSKNPLIEIDDVYQAPEQSFSTVGFIENRGLAFYQFISKTEQKEEIAQQLKHYQELLASEAKCNALRDFLNRINEKQAISLK